MTTGSVKRSWTKATIGMVSSQIEIRSGKNRSIRAVRGMRPNEKLAMPDMAEATGSTSLGNWICLISRSEMTTELTPSLTAVLNHFQGRMAEKMKIG